MGFRPPKLAGAAPEGGDAANSGSAANTPRGSVGGSGRLSSSIAGLNASPPAIAARRWGSSATDGSGAGGASSPREIFYPAPAGKTQDEILAARMAKRTNVEYHQPPPSVKKGAAAAASSGTIVARYDEEGNLVRTAAVIAAEAAAAADRALDAGVGGGAAMGASGSSSLSFGVDAATVGGAEGAEAGGEDEEEPEEAGDIISRLPISANGKLYFQVETDGATKHETVGIIIIDTTPDASGIQMYDRLGRQHGNREDPGYPLKREEIDNACAGATMRVGTKAVLLITALREEAFRSGEFFLRSEHQARKKDEKRKAKADAAAAEAAKAAKPRMNFGAGFGALTLRRRPAQGSTGFTVPIAGRPKTPGAVWEIKALHDADRENAMVLFRADYKRDANGQQIVSVVVDPVVGDKLRPHQRIGVKFLYDCVTGERMPGYFGCILADEMGLGKTVQTVATVYTCLKQGKFGRPVSRKALVVAPSSLVRNWCNEFDKWLGEGVVKYFAISESTPKGDRILSRFESEGDVLVISYDQLRKYIDRIAKISAVDLCVCDEGHRLKNAEIKTTKAVDMLPTRRRIILSGTPIQNDLSEFHAMVGFVNPGILGNRDLFGRVFEEPIMRGRDPECPDPQKELGADRAHYLANLTQMFILRRTQTINEKYLPAKVDCTVFVRLGAEQRAAYQRVSALASDPKSGLSSTPLVLISALKKLCNHMDLLVDAVRTSAASSKVSGRPALPAAVLPKGYKEGQLDYSFGSKLSFVSLMLDELTTNGDRDKLVIVSNYTQTLDIIARLCASKKVAFFQLDGNTPIKKRQELVDLFNIPMASEIVFLLSSKAGGVGLNLIGANRLILFDPDWNPANDAQAMGRVWRDGQKKKVFIYRLLSTGTIEEKVYQRQVSKQGLSANVVDMKEDSKQHFTLEEMKALFDFRPDTRCDTHDLLGCKCQLDAAALAAAVGAGGGGFRKVGGGGAPSGPRMDELKSWQHIADVKGFTLDKVMMKIAGRNKDLVSFLFANERDAKKIEELQCDASPFAADEGKITVSCSQAGGGGSKGGGGDPEDDVELDIVNNDSSSDSDDADGSCASSDSEGGRAAEGPLKGKKSTPAAASPPKKTPPPAAASAAVPAAPSPAKGKKGKKSPAAEKAAAPKPAGKKGPAKKRGRNDDDDEDDGDFINDDSSDTASVQSVSSGDDSEESAASASDDDDDDDADEGSDSDDNAKDSTSKKKGGKKDKKKKKKDDEKKKKKKKDSKSSSVDLPSPPPPPGRRSARLEAMRRRREEEEEERGSSSDSSSSSSDARSPRKKGTAKEKKKKPAAKKGKAASKTTTADHDDASAAADLGLGGFDFDGSSPLDVVCIDDDDADDLLLS